MECLLSAARVDIRVGADDLFITQVETPGDIGKRVVLLTVII